MTSKQLERICGVLKIRTLADIDARTRSLRRLGFLPMGGRGPHAPHLEPVHVANFLLSLASETASAAAEAVQAYSIIKAAGSERSLVAVLADEIENDASDVQVVRLCREKCVAEIVRKRDGVLVRDRYGLPPDLANHLFENDHFGTSTCLTWVEIGRGFLRQLFIEMNTDEADKSAFLDAPK